MPVIVLFTIYRPHSELYFGKTFAPDPLTTRSSSGSEGFQCPVILEKSLPSVLTLSGEGSLCLCNKQTSCLGTATKPSRRSRGWGGEEDHRPLLVSYLELGRIEREDAYKMLTTLLSSEGNKI